MSAEAMAGRAVIDRYHRAIAVGDYDVVTALHAPEVVVWMSGQSIVSGRFQGRTELFAHMTHHVLGPLDTQAEDYVKAVRVVAEAGDRVAVIFHGGLPNRSGGRYDQYYLQIFRMADGLIQEIVELFDTVMFEQAVAGNRLRIARTQPRTPFGVGDALSGASSRQVMADLADAWLAAVSVGDWPATALLAGTNCTLAVAGTTPLSGVSPFEVERLRAVLEGGVGWSRIACTDHRASVVLMRGADPSYPQNYGVVLEADGDHLGRVSIFWDTAAAEARLYHNEMLPEPTTSIMPSFDLRLAFEG
ncbi:nuclear transport factor 2 family protein [Rhizorhabdus phycosphaerae]|uniref:nuclear transport factor 2 family protein n=1 Tax=Rhizorhabdus phycosphaerae TaxID=2711156 RepID=UPI0013EC99F1|nr:nuclear transport factor 2 family protein [Rhizorhabdus phycosphaerae]